MSREFASAALTVGQLNAIVKKLGGHDRALSFLRDELLVSEPTRLWREEGGIIYFSVTSDGTAAEDWISRLEDDGYDIGDIAKQVLRSPDFKPTKGVTTKVSVLKDTLFSGNDRTTKNILELANKRKLLKPNVELACLIRQKFTDKDIEAMGLRRIVTMHKPASGSDGDLRLLCAERFIHERWFHTFKIDSLWEWGRGCGFAFSMS